MANGLRFINSHSRTLLLFREFKVVAGCFFLSSSWGRISRWLGIESSANYVVTRLMKAIGMIRKIIDNRAATQWREKNLKAITAQVFCLRLQGNNVLNKPWKSRFALFLFFFIESALPSKEAHSIDDTISLFLFISMSHSCLFKERKSTRIAAFYIFAKMSEGRRSTFFMATIAENLLRTMARSISAIMPCECY